MVFKVKVKWGKESFPDIELDTSEPPLVFKAQLFALTGVQPERQKIMVKGSTVKEETWDGVKCKDGSMILMMGSRDEDIPSAPTEKPTFIEDMTEEEINSTLELPVGITNLGNTCYLNSVVQCFKCVPEIHNSIKSFDLKASEASVSGPMLVTSIQDIFRTMDQGRTAIPIVFVDLFRRTFPRFAEQGEGGKYMQQDASECWTELLRLLSDVLPTEEKEKVAEKFNSSIVSQYFSGSMLNKWKCVEDETEEEKVTTDTFTQLSCHINVDIKYLQTGLVARMTAQIDKHSQKLDRDAVYTKHSTVTRLPGYLSVEMVRFFYKEKQNINAKIVKDVKFPIILDVFELCSSELKEKLLTVRDKYKDMETRQLEDAKNFKKGKPSDFKKSDFKTLPSHFEDDLGSNNSGFYDLKAVVTHQGRSSSAGHYIAWVKFRPHEWLKCDDDEVTAVTEEEILKLSGGGDWHTAYILLYGPHVLDVPINENAKSDDSKMEVDETKIDDSKTKDSKTEEKTST